MNLFIFHNYEKITHIDRSPANLTSDDFIRSNEMSIDHFVLTI